MSCLWLKGFIRTFRIFLSQAVIFLWLDFLFYCWWVPGVETVLGTFFPSVLGTVLYLWEGLGWLDQGLGHTFFLQRKGWATHNFYTEIQVNKEIKLKNYGIRLFVQIPSELQLKEKLASHLLTSHESSSVELPFSPPTKTSSEFDSLFEDSSDELLVLWGSLLWMLLRCSVMYLFRSSFLAPSRQISWCSEHVFLQFIHAYCSFPRNYSPIIFIVTPVQPDLSLPLLSLRSFKVI